MWLHPSAAGRGLKWLECVCVCGWVWVGVCVWRWEGGFIYSLERTAKPLWLLRNPLQNTMCIMAALPVSAPSEGILLFTASSLRRFKAICLKLWLALLSTFRYLYISLSECPPSLPSLLLLEGLAGWGRGGEEISGDYHRLENTDGFVHHLSSQTLCQPALH